MTFNHDGFQPTCATCTMGSYASLSVCLGLQDLLCAPPQQPRATCLAVFLCLTYKQAGDYCFDRYGSSQCHVTFKKCLDCYLIPSWYQNLNKKIWLHFKVRGKGVHTALQASHYLSVRELCQTFNILIVMKCVNVRGDNRL